MTDHTCAVCFAALPPHLVGDLPAPERPHAGVHLLCDRQECRDTLDAEDERADDTAPTPPYISTQEPCGDPRSAAVVLAVDSRGQSVTAFVPCGDAVCGWCRGCTAPLAVSTAIYARWPNGLGESAAGRAVRPATEEERTIHGRVAAAAGYGHSQPSGARDRGARRRGLRPCRAPKSLA